jgi:hypothetical protein
MKSFFFFAIGLILAAPAWAQPWNETPLNKVSLQLTSEQWVMTKTALVNVNVNAAVNNQGLEQIQNNVTQKLNSIAPGEWHIMSFDRQLDKSGLESVQIAAQARLPQAQLTGLRDKAKKITLPGMTFTIDTIQFVPSEGEIRQANINLRNNIYQQAKQELDTLNKIYPNQKYFLNQINFFSTPPVSIMPMAQTSSMNGKMARNANASPSLSVGNRQELQATVVLAAALNNNQNGTQNKL